MYSIRAELMYRHYIKDGSLDLSDIERISLASYDDLLGEMYDYEIVPVKGKGVKLTEFLYDYKLDMENIIYLYGDYDFPSDMTIADVMDTPFFNNKIAYFCLYHFGTHQFRIRMVNPIFVYKTKKLLDECNRIIEDGCVPYEVAPFKFETIIQHTKAIDSYITIDGGIRIMLMLLEGDDLRNYLYWLSVLVTNYKLVQAHKDGFRYVNYFNSDLLRRLEAE